jgi:hypothetical protein
VSISTYHPERGLEIYNFLLPPNNKHPFAAPAWTRNLSLS